MSERVTDLGVRRFRNIQFPPHFRINSGNNLTGLVVDRHNRGNAMEWIVRLECRDKSRVLHERPVARFERQTDV